MPNAIHSAGQLELVLTPGNEQLAMSNQVTALTRMKWEALFFVIIHTICHNALTGVVEVLAKNTSLIFQQMALDVV